MATPQNEEMCYAVVVQEREGRFSEPVFYHRDPVQASRYAAQYSKEHDLSSVMTFVLPVHVCDLNRDLSSIIKACEEWWNR